MFMISIYLFYMLNVNSADKQQGDVSSTKATIPKKADTGGIYFK